MRTKKWLSSCVLFLLTVSFLYGFLYHFSGSTNRLYEGEKEKESMLQHRRKNKQKYVSNSSVRSHSGGHREISTAGSLELYYSHWSGWEEYFGTLNFSFATVCPWHKNREYSDEIQESLQIRITVSDMKETLDTISFSRFYIFRNESAYSYNIASNSRDFTLAEGDSQILHFSVTPHSLWDDMLYFKGYSEFQNSSDTFSGSFDTRNSRGYLMLDVKVVQVSLTSSLNATSVLRNSTVEISGTISNWHKLSLTLKLSTGFSMYTLVKDRQLSSSDFSYMCTIPTDIPPQSYTLIVQVPGAEEELTINIYNHAPSLQITQLPNSRSIAEKLAVKAKISDKDNTVTSLQCSAKLILDGATIQEVAGTTHGNQVTFTFNLSSLKAQTYKVNVSVIDPEGASVTKQGEVNIFLPSYLSPYLYFGLVSSLFGMIGLRWFRQGKLTDGEKYYMLLDVVGLLGGVFLIVSPFLAWFTDSFTLFGVSGVIKLTGLGELNILNITFPRLANFGYLTIVSGIILVASQLLPNHSQKKLVTFYGTSLAVASFVGWFLALSSFGGEMGGTMKLGLGLFLWILGICFLLFRVFGFYFPTKLPWIFRLKVQKNQEGIKISKIQEDSSEKGS